jgi:hypothetical protein
MRRTAAAVVATLAVAGCGGGDEDQAVREPTRDQIVAAMRETQPECAEPRQERLKGGTDLENLFISCGRYAVLVHIADDAASAQRIAHSGGGDQSGLPPDFVAGRVVIVPHSIKDPEGFRKVLAQKCACEVARD